jgi:hypothetical protein
MKSSLESDEVCPACGLPGQLNGPFYGLCPAVGEIIGVKVRRHNFIQSLDEPEKGFMEGQVLLTMKHEPGLFANSLHHSRMAVTGIGDPDSTCKIKITAAIMIPDIRAFSADNNGIHEVRHGFG